MLSKNLTAASSRPIILGILKQGTSYGYLIIKKLKELSGGKIEWSDGMLYPVLHKLEKENLIKAKWELAENGRPRKYYTITDLGKQELINEEKQWNQVNAVLSVLWKQNHSTT
ncbi:PadR family transcriptional regulator [Ekhidna sp.]|uniref:PadR family transcriptional regulator n=1 Tax=Ekhidna sp. TaxID=2608089 RepID=UPI003C7CCCB1